MNAIRTLDLKFNYFSSSFDTEIPLKQRYEDYENWKLMKYKEMIELEQLVNDHDPYVVCSTCQLKIAKLNKVGPISNSYFRELFECI